MVLKNKEINDVFNVKVKIIRERSFFPYSFIPILFQFSSLTFVLWDISALKKKIEREKPTIGDDLLSKYFCLCKCLNMALYHSMDWSKSGSTFELNVWRSLL